MLLPILVVFGATLGVSVAAGIYAYRFCHRKGLSDPYWRRGSVIRSHIFGVAAIYAFWGFVIFGAAVIFWALRSG